MHASPAPAHITRVDRMWMLRPFLHALKSHAHERVLLEQLDKCIRTLFLEPQSPGLRLERLNLPDLPLLSARIAQGPRLILYPFSQCEVGLLYFDQHDEAYAWVDRHRTTIPTMLGKVEEVARDRPVRMHGLAVPVPRSDEDDPIALEAAEQFGRMVADGIARYLAALDDDQQSLVRARPQGVLVVKGGAGTGKTAVAIHRALARAQQASMEGPEKVLFLCYNRLLATAVQQAMTALAGAAWSERVEVQTFHTWCEQFLREQGAPAPQLNQDEACQQQVFRAFGKISAESKRVLTEAKLFGRFVDDEINTVIKHLGLTSLEDYRKVQRHGRKTGISQAVREAVWEVYELSERYIHEQGICRWSDLPLMALHRLQNMATPPVYREVVVDEAQDCSPVMMRLARQLAGGARGNLSVFVDPAQCIFANGFQWTQEELYLKGTNEAARRKRGVEIRWLKKNFRLTRELYEFTRPLLAGHSDLRDDLDRWPEPERHGATPVLYVAATDAAVHEGLADAVAQEARQRPLEQIAVLAATHAVLDHMGELLRTRGIAAKHIRFGGDGLLLDEPVVKLLTMQSAKGLDFPAVFVVGPGAGDLGGPQRADLPEPARTLHVALTRASEKLTVGLVDEQHHRAFAAVAHGGYQAQGPRATAFVNRWRDL